MNPSPSSLYSKTEYPLLLLMFFQSVASVDTSCLLCPYELTFPNLILTILAGKKINLKKTSKNYTQNFRLQNFELEPNHPSDISSKRINKNCAPSILESKCIYGPERRETKTTWWCPTVQSFLCVYLDKMIPFNYISYFSKWVGLTFHHQTPRMDPAKKNFWSKGLGLGWILAEIDWYLWEGDAFFESFCTQSTSFCVPSQISLVAQFSRVLIYIYI